MFNKFNRNVSIKKRIYLGFGVSIIGAIFVALLAISSFDRLDKNSRKLERLAVEVAKIAELNALITGVKRNVANYIYTGSESTKKNVEKSLEKTSEFLSQLKFEFEISKNFKFVTRLKSHLEVYSHTFENVVEEYSLRKSLVKKDIPEIIAKLSTKSNLYLINKIKLLISDYREAPSAKKVKDALKNIDLLSKKQTSSKDRKLVSDLRSSFLRLTYAIKGYLYLTNVVLAGETAEFYYVSQEMKKGSIRNSEDLRTQLEKNNDDIRKQLITTLIILIVSVSFYSWLIASGISEPLGEITRTLGNITAGDLNTSIPGQDREDEIGTLSKAADTFRERSLRLESSNDELSQFAYRTSHDLKAPLLSIIGLTDIIKEDLEDGDLDEVRSNISKIDFSASKLEGLIMDILNLSRADHLKEDVKDVDLVDVAKSIESKLEHLFSENNIKFQKENIDNESIFVQDTRLRQVIENLVSNAIKYSDPQKEERFVKFGFVEKQGSKEIYVEDNGLGIEEKYHKNIFGMFQRFHTDVSFGSGLGLYLVRKHVEKMGGEITFKSQKGKGSTFTIIFYS